MNLVFFLCLGFTQLGWVKPSWTGERGAPWSQEEILMVKAKLVQVFLSTGSVYNEYLSLHPEVEPPKGGANYPNGPKMLRLGFHGCLRTSNGTGGGCNGCLNPRNMRVDVGEKYDFDNGGLVSFGLSFRLRCGLCFPSGTRTILNGQQWTWDDSGRAGGDLHK